MKRYIQKTIQNLAYISFVAVSSFNVSAQITIESFNMPMVGETVTRYIDTIPAFGPGPAGGTQVWDFSMAESHDTAITQMVMPSAYTFCSWLSIEQLGNDQR